MPLKAWVKSALDLVIQDHMAEPGLEFVWVGDDAVDPLEQAQTLQILVGAGIKTREEARADLGLAPAAGVGAPPNASAKPQVGLGKLFNPDQPRDDDGRWTSDGASAPVGSSARKPRPTRVQVANNDAVMSDAGAADVAQIVEPEPPPIEPPVEEGRSEIGAGATNPSTSSDGPSETARFSSEELLNGHFEDHGSDFGATTASEYEQQASDFLTN